jgi:hypothetical protein
MITESTTELDRLREAYIAMSKRAKYRPAAPIDECGNITLSDEALADPQQQNSSKRQSIVERFLSSL